MDYTKGIACKCAPLTNMHTDIKNIQKDNYTINYKYTKNPFSKEKWWKNKLYFHKVIDKRWISCFLASFLETLLLIVVWSAIVDNAKGVQST